MVENGVEFNISREPFASGTVVLQCVKLTVRLIVCQDIQGLSEGGGGRGGNFPCAPNVRVGPQICKIKKQ